MSLGATFLPPFPVSHKHLSLPIKNFGLAGNEDAFVLGFTEISFLPGNKTEILISSYEDRFLVIATQIGTMGTILHARKEEGMPINPTFNVSVIFGKRDEQMLEACARQLIEHMSSSGSSKPLVLSLGLKDHSTETLKAIVSAVIDNRLW